MTFPPLDSKRAWRTAVLMGGGLLAVAAVPVAASELEERMPASMLIEMVDPTLCAPPPSDMSDTEIIAMLDSDDPEMAPPIAGAWEQQDARWRAYGHGWFNDSSSGLVVGTMLMLRSDSDELRYLCMVLSPHADTSMVGGEAALVGPDVETIDGDTFMAMGMLGERRDGLGEVLAEAGSAHFEQTGADTLDLSLTFDGRLVGMDEQAPGNAAIYLSLEGELNRDSRMRVVDWGRDDLVDTSAPSVSEELLAEVKALFRDDIRLEVEPIVTPESNAIVQFPVYRYNYNTFDAQSGDSSRPRTNEGFFYRNDEDQLLPFQRPTSDTDLSTFFSGLLATDVILDETTADDFRELLITLTGEDFFEEQDVKLDNIVNFRPDEWIFFTGTFFDHYKAFVVYTDEKGHPEKVLYRLKQQPAS